jgi:hypothetical protein
MWANVITFYLTTALVHALFAPGNEARHKR